MKNLSNIIVGKRKLFALLFGALMIFSVFSFSWVHVEMDISTYLDEASDTKQGLRIMRDEFVSYAETRILVRDAQQPQALQEQMEALDGVCLVKCQTAEDTKAVVYDVVFNGVFGEEAVTQAMDQLRTILKDTDFTIVTTAAEDLAGMLSREMTVVLILSVAIVIAVLLLTSSTYAEIPVLLLTFLAAAIINMGTNFLMGTISFVSNTVAVVMQLALSIDYAIILCNRYKEEHLTKDIEEAVRSALASSIPAISASSLTTVAGLAAMTFMRFALGMDMGIALIKSIIISLLTVFLFMPFLLVTFGRWMDKTPHRSFVPSVSFAGRFAYKTRFVVPLLFLAIVAVAYVGFQNVSYDFDDSLMPIINESEERQAEREIREQFGDSNPVALMVPAGNDAAEAAFIAELEAMPEVKRVLGMANIEAVDGYKLTDRITYADFMSLADVDETTAKALFAYYAADAGEAEAVSDGSEGYSVRLIDIFVKLHELANSGEFPLEEKQVNLVNDLYGQLTMVLDQLKGDHYSCIIVYLDLPVQGEETFAFLDQTVELAKSHFGDDVYLTGDPVAAKDFSETFAIDTRTVTLLSIVMVIVILLLTFRSPVMPLLLILVIQGSIWLNFAIAAWSHSYVFFMCYLIVSSIQMGANIDYAIVISTRYGEMRQAGLAPGDAMLRALNLAFPTIITSGTMMVTAGLLIGFRVSEPVIAGMGLYVGTGTIITLLLVIFALPQLLLAGDRVVQATTLPLPSAERLRRPAALLSAVLVLAGVVCTGCVTPSLRDTTQQEAAQEEHEALTTAVEELKTLHSELDAEGIGDTKYDFAEAVVTEDIGSQKLADGQAQVDAGRAQLDDAKQQVADHEAEYRQGVETYEASVARYEAAKKKLADGQAQYDDGVAQLQEAKVRLAEGEEQLERIAPLYERIIPLYQRYQNTQQRYDSAVAQNDWATVALLSGRLAADKALFESTLLGTGYSLSGIVKEYEDGQAQVADGQAQIAAAETELADAKAQLEDGKAQLADAEVQLAQGKAKLADARAQLDDAHAQIADGETELQAAEVQLTDGKTQLQENAHTLSRSLASLNEYTDRSEKLRAGIRMLLQVQDISDAVQDRSDAAEIFTAAEDYLTASAAAAEKTANLQKAALLVLHTAAAVATLTVLLGILRKKRLLRGAALLTAVLGLAAVILCGMGFGVRTAAFALSALFLLAPVAFALTVGEASSLS